MCSIILVLCLLSYHTVTAVFEPQIGSIECFRDYMSISVASYGGEAIIVGNEDRANCRSRTFPWSVRVYAEQSAVGGRCVYMEAPVQVEGDETKLIYSVTVHFLTSATITVHQQERKYQCVFDKDPASEVLTEVTANTPGLEIIPGLSVEVPSMIVVFAAPQEGGSISGDYEVITEASVGDQVYLFVEISNPANYIWDRIRVPWINYSNNAAFESNPGEGKFNLQFYCNGCPDRLLDLLGGPVFDKALPYNGEDTTLIIGYSVTKIGVFDEIHLRVFIEFCDEEESPGRCNVLNDQCPEGVDNYQPCYLDPTRTHVSRQPRTYETTMVDVKLNIRQNAN